MEPCGSEAAIHARSCMGTSENTSSRQFRAYGPEGRRTMSLPWRTALRGCLSNHSLEVKSIYRIHPAVLAEFICAAIDVVVPIVRLAHPMPGQSRIEHGDGPLIRSLAAFGAFVQVLGHHEVERHG